MCSSDLAKLVPELINLLAPAQASLISNATVISQYAALYALEHREYTDHYAAILKKNRDVVCDFFEQLRKSGAVEFGVPQAGFYLFFKTQGGDSAAFVMDLLEKARVALTPGKDFGPSAEHFVRLCFARDSEVIAKSITRLKDYFSARHISAMHAQKSSSLL